MWIWVVKHCEGGDADRIVAKARAAGIRWLAVKNVDDRLNAQVSRPLVERIKNAGLGFYTWHYSYPGVARVGHEIERVRGLFDLGIDGHVIDAEIEWEQTGDHRADAADLLDGLRATLGDTAWIAHAPWPVAHAHPSFPWRELGAGPTKSGHRGTDAQMDQLYWTEWSSLGMAGLAAKADQDWAQLATKVPGAVSVRAPIGSCYSQRQPARGGDVAAFLERYRETPFISLYSWDACSADVWSMLQARAAGQARPGTALETLADVQHALIALGYNPGPVDGLPGEKTASAIMAFQRAEALTPDGIAGPITKRKLADLLLAQRAHA
jgi:hypothetical protein